MAGADFRLHVGPSTLFDFSEDPSSKVVRAAHRQSTWGQKRGKAGGGKNIKNKLIPNQKCVDD